MDKIKSLFPILFSPTFYGLTLSFLFRVASFYGWADEQLLLILSNWLASVTGVNIIWKSATKINK